MALLVYVAVIVSYHSMYPVPSVSMYSPMYGVCCEEIYVYIIYDSSLLLFLFITRWTHGFYCLKIIGVLNFLFRPQSGTMPMSSELLIKYTLPALKSTCTWFLIFSMWSLTFVCTFEVRFSRLSGSVWVFCHFRSTCCGILPFVEIFSN